MGGIPTIEIRKDTASFDALPYDEDGTDASIIGQSFSDAFPCTFDQDHIDIFDIYEDGSPMVDGRTWQCSGIKGFPTSSICPNIPSALPHVFTRINVPMVYERAGDDNLWSVLYLTNAWNGSYVGLFRGRFHPEPSSEVEILPGYIPVFVEASSITGTWLEHGETDTEGIDIGPFDSGGWIWTLASCASSTTNSAHRKILPAPIKRWEISTPESYERRAFRCREESFFSALVFCEPSQKIFAPNESVYNISTPCYRRGNSHATFVWPGFHPY